MVSDDPVALQTTFNIWAQALESHGLKISQSKTETMTCLFSDLNGATPDFSLNEELLPKCESFKYLGSMLNNYGTCDDDVNHRISVGWMK